MPAMQTKAYKGIGMEGRIAKWYAANTRKDLHEVTALAHRLAGGLAPGSEVLEVAPGPGYCAIELARAGNVRVTGLDISATFVDLARKNAAAAGVEVDFQHGNAAHMPFASGAFDAIVCRAAFKNFSEPVLALKEMCRVLKTGAKALILDMRGDAPNEALDAEVAKLNLSAVNSFITKWTFRLMLVRRAYTRAEFVDFIRQTEFTSSDIRETPIGLEISLVK
ncbi:MAG TPA: class I SAM-dependent methyltransferase [Candidatus Binataceae bacterium]